MCLKLFDFDDYILSNIGGFVLDVVNVFGSKSIEIKLKDKKILIERPVEKPEESFYDRLNEVINSSNNISIKNNVPYEKIIGILLVLDGWSWNKFVFRAPIWMIDHQEIPVEDARRIRGLEWIKGTSLEIKLKPSME